MPWSDESEELKQRVLGRLSRPEILASLAGVVDLGAGAGLWRHHAQALSIRAKHWLAVEVWLPNVKRFNLRERYDAVRVADFRRIKYGRYPGCAFIFGDVLEHLSREDALDVIRRAASMGSVVIVMPFHPSSSAEQGPGEDGNEYERHLYVWQWLELLEELWRLEREFRGELEIVQQPPGRGRNKGAVILWHHSHRSLA